MRCYQVIDVVLLPYRPFITYLIQHNLYTLKMPALPPHIWPGFNHFSLGLHKGGISAGDTWEDSHTFPSVLWCSWALLPSRALMSKKHLLAHCSSVFLFWKHLSFLKHSQISPLPPHTPPCTSKGRHPGCPTPPWQCQSCFSSSLAVASWKNAEAWPWQLSLYPP